MQFLCASQYIAVSLMTMFSLVARIAAGSAMRMHLQRADQGTALTVGKLGTGLDIDLRGLDVGIPLIIRILAPEDHGHLGGVVRFPNSLIGAVFRRHGFGKADDSCAV